MLRGRKSPPARRVPWRECSLGAGPCQGLILAGSEGGLPVNGDWRLGGGHRFHLGGEEAGGLGELGLDLGKAL